MHGQQMIIKRDTPLANDLLNKTKNKAKREIDNAETLLCITSDGRTTTCTSMINPNQIHLIMGILMDWTKGCMDSQQRIDNGELRGEVDNENIDKE
jgi:hypothetical protein